MDYLKYFKDNKYDYENNNCLDFVRQVYKDEHNVELPECPIFENKSEYESFIKANVKYRLVNKAFKGCLVHISDDKNEHLGYAIDDKKYIHKLEKGVTVAPIPKKCLIYEVLND